MKTQSQTQKTKEPKLLTAGELAEKAGCHLQIAGHGSVAITADVYRTVEQDGLGLSSRGSGRWVGNPRY